MSGRSLQPSDYLRAIRRRWQVVVAVTVLVLVAALVISLTGQKKYDATADLLFGGQDEVQSLLTPDAQIASNDPEREINTSVQLIKLDAVADAVRDRLGLQTPIRDLLEQVETESSSSSNIVSVTVRDPFPQRAVAIANGFAEEYAAYRRRIARQTYDQAAELAEAQLNALPPEQQQSEEAQTLRNRRRELELTAALQTGGVQVVRRATMPRSAATPRPKLSAALGGMLGLILGLAIALALEFADRRMKDESTVEETFDLPLLAAIPPPPRRGADDHLQREAYGLLAANVRLGMTGDSHVLMVTSPTPEDGKTSVSLGLARALARLGVRVILIEADLRRPSIVRYTGLQQNGGLTALLAHPDRHLMHEVTWVDASTMQPVTLDDLKEGLSFAILTAGAVAPHPQRLLARPEMARVVETARSLADVVIIDTPPIGTVNDPVTLARFVDSVLVVSRLNKTTKDAARRALRVLRNISAQLPGVVITGAELGDQYDYYEAERPAPRTPAVEAAER